MFVVLFEVWPKPERWDEYLEIARLLRPELEQSLQCSFFRNANYRVGFHSVAAGAMTSFELPRGAGTAE